ncbi:gluconate 2-dehydrogenase subunit 3 family protein [Rhodohalobacter sulfatireducens]|uniref:Gluconate 2-dehydrogenase subunit 3 family protein n=1 Tax=Rhodohalobacter sulfatireducens TaxID=2911366 RepID=A0ABS9KG97_9BACT|nr:gluconate 2-dehydrogenase subunit 3 family protein [Rhodohalobacter sulfatireducens]MCG2589850.1 gluconate 2-dehydrogenase subunit 3 family protein [Rhodohalobacter sulfatireducens]
MKRREALKTLGLAAAGLVTLPAWASGWTARDVAIKSSTFSSTEQALLASVADTIIPAKNNVGAIPQEVHKFLVRLFDECYEKEKRENIKRQLNVMNNLAMKDFDSSFMDSSQQQREQILLSFSESEDESEQEFFQLVKIETIRGFRTSKVVMQDYHGYRLVPGFYNGNVDVEA